MDDCNKGDLIKVLKEKAAEAKGALRESLMYKISKLETTTPANCYSMQRIITRDALSFQIFIEKQLVRGLGRIQKTDPDNEVIALASRNSSLRLFHLKKELTKEFSGEYSEFARADGLLTFKLEDFELDPCLDARYIMFYTDRTHVCDIDLNQSASPIEIQLDKTSTIEIELCDADKSIVYGLVLIPTVFFIENANSSVILEINTFNFITLSLGFQMCKLIYRANKRFQCYVKAQHLFEKVENTNTSYCNVCAHLCKLYHKVYVCFKCRVICHLQCIDFILFTCRAEQEYTRVGSLVHTEKNSKAGPLRVHQNRYNIAHSFKPAVSAGIRYCRHCGLRIKIGANMIHCSVCEIYCHAACEVYAFNSCGITRELRRKMVELQIERLRHIKEHSTMKITDFQLLETIGKGSFGKVLKAQKKGSDEIYAIKAIKKQNIYTPRDYTNLESEKAILRMLSGRQAPFITQLQFSFHDNRYIYIGLDYEPGGDLHAMVYNSKLPEDIARLYTAEILIGLEFLHINNIAYRDLKLDNILLTADGHIKLCDFGLSKCQMGPHVVTYTYCGSLDTVAPEVLNGEGYTRAVDFWSLGIVVYEMMHRKAPFYGATIKELARSIAMTDLEIDESLSEEAKDFINRLLAKNPDTRLGIVEDGIYTIMSHPWFNKINWDLARKRKLKVDPSIIPEKDAVPRDFSASPQLTPTLSVADLLNYVKMYSKNKNKKREK